MSPRLSFVREQLGEERGVVKDDAVGDQSPALRPEVLFVFGPKAQLSIVGIGDRATQFVIAFPTVYGPLHVLERPFRSSSVLIIILQTSEESRSNSQRKMSDSLVFSFRCCPLTYVDPPLHCIICHRVTRLKLLRPNRYA